MASAIQAAFSAFLRGIDGASASLAIVFFASAIWAAVGLGRPKLSSSRAIFASSRFTAGAGLAAAVLAAGALVFLFD
ncbi:hypothetical protein D3C72_1230520 [compost metagenome]